MAAYTEAAHTPRAAYRVKEVAAALGLSLAACYQQIESGGIPHVRIGGRVFIPAGFFRELGLEDPVRTRYADGSTLGVPAAYTVAQVAAALGSAVPNIYELTARGVIPMSKDGCRRVVPAAFFGQVGLEAPVVDLRNRPHQDAEVSITYMYTEYMDKSGERSGSVGRVAYSLQETAAETGKTFSAVYQQMQAGNIPTCRIGRRHLVPVSYLRDHAINPASKDS